MQRYNKSWRSKGSITVEACVTLPIFLSVFFLLLFLVRFTCTGMVLDYAVNETAKEIAASAYPVSFINELEDEKIEEYESSAGKAGQVNEGGSYDSILNLLISRDFNDTDVSETINEVLEQYSKSIERGLTDRITPIYWDEKSAGKYAIAEAIIGEHLDNPLINNDDVRLSLVEFPQSKAEYDANFGSQKYESSGLIPGKDFSIDDVVIQLEYGYRVKLPFLDALDVKLVHTAVERAWVNGSFGVLTVEEEGLSLEPEGTTVFITRTGIRYHKGNCWHLRRSKLPVEIMEAKERGYTPCKVCKPLP